MNSASWTLLRNSSTSITFALRNVTATSVVAPIRSGISKPFSNASLSAIRSGQRFYNSSYAPSPNIVKHHNDARLSRLLAYRQSIAINHYSSTSTRLAPVVRRGFASASSSSSSSASIPSKAQQGDISATKKSSGFMDKFKDMVKKYGYTGVAVYLGISMVDLAATFVIVKAAGMDKIEKAQDWVVDNIGKYFGYKHHDEKKVETSNNNEGAVYNKASGLWSVFVIAYGIHKLLVPLRVVATSMITPPLVRWFIKRGWMKETVKKGAAVTTGAGAGAGAKP